MARIVLEGMAFFARHGYYIHEQVRGNQFEVDVMVEAEIDQAAQHDDLHETINYEIIYRICTDIMDQPCKLIETVVYRIAHEIRKSFPQSGMIEVKVHKLTPELGGQVKRATVIYTL